METTSKKNYLQFQKKEELILTDDFNLSEFVCPCDKCDDQILNLRLPKRLQWYRDYLNNRAIALGINLAEGKEIAIIINSGFRCSAHNKQLDGKKDSQHLLGNAVDIVIVGWAGLRYDKAAMEARALGFTGIGIGKTFLHLDIRDGKKHGMGFALWEYGDK